MEFREVAYDDVVLEAMVCNRGKQLFRHGMQSIGVVKHVHAFAPGFLAGFVNLVREGFWKRRIGIMVMVGAHAEHSDVAFAEAGLLAHSVEFGDGAACGKHDRADVFGVWLEEETGWDFLGAYDVPIDFLRGDD